ncbi:MAG: hypothetical protein AB7N91_03855 [Candidatus Tectimicrobiota bacterium]
MTLWEGTYEGKRGTWLRWTDANGVVIPSGKERAEQERERAEQERLAREAMQGELEQARQRVEQLAALLRQMGHEPPA